MVGFWAIKQHRPSLWVKRFVLITDCSAITWLITSQTLSAKLYRWALRMMEYDVDLLWRPVMNHRLPDALSVLLGLSTGVLRGRCSVG